MDGLQPDRFLRDCWQKQPLFLRQAVPDGLPAIDPDELAWLATLEDVESRLVFTERRGNRQRYRVEHGPFTEEEIRQLPERDWSLLVNDVDKHLPDLKPIVGLVDFIPDWRLDDLMISFAAPGGGVGPHKDNYDVFLCQAQGNRQWLYTNSEVRPDNEASSDLALLQPFDAEPHIAQATDLLYLPPGTPHWGTAIDACLTYSIGMRAPRASDLYVASLPEFEDPFYADPDLTTDEVQPGYISGDAIDRAVTLLNGALPRQEVARRLGCFVTRNKTWLRPDGMSEFPDGELRLHGMARIAWDDGHVYANGESRALCDDERNLIRALCKARRFSRVDRDAFASDDPKYELLEWLLRRGAFEPDD